MAEKVVSYMINLDVVLLPQSALEVLTRFDVSYPMLFSVKAQQSGRLTHCGVLEFSAAEGVVYLPDWMFRQLGLAVGAEVEVSDVTVPRGTFAKIQPQSVDFLDITDPRAVYPKYVTLTF